MPNREQGGSVPEGRLAVGYFDDPAQTEPAYDPGLDVDCPICCEPLNIRPRKTLSAMRMGDGRSYFYRTHRDCFDDLDERERTLLDSIAMKEADHA